MKFLIIDNYDSFVYNLAQRLGELGVTSDVIRNDELTINQIKNGNYDAIVISPGPGTPDDESGRDLLDMGIIPLENLIPEVALVKAMWVLGNSDSNDEIKKMMLEDYASEFFTE